MDSKDGTRGYKIVDANLQGFGGFQFEVGKTFEVKGDLKMCGNGFHFCEKALNCHEFIDYPARPWRFLYVEAKSDMATEGNKSVTKILHVDREIAVDEWVLIATKEAISPSHAHKLLTLGAAIGNLDLVMRALRVDLHWVDITSAMTAAASGGHIDALHVLKKIFEVSGCGLFVAPKCRLAERPNRIHGIGIALEFECSKL